MKKVLLLVCLISTAVFAQSDSTKSKITGYTSLGLSVSTGNDFLSTSYPSLEGGIMRDNLCLGIVAGRGNFVGMGQKSDNIQNYYYEGKMTACLPLGILTGSVIFGYGGYFKSKHMFIEYGGGVSYTKGNISYGVLCSNWDNVVYLTPSITLNF